MKLSSVSPHNITRQALDPYGRLVTEFCADGVINRDGGTLVCQLADIAALAPENREDFDSLTVTRLMHRFWDDGIFTPDGIR